jgi:outer membrane lipoprotein SlyB
MVGATVGLLVGELVSAGFDGAMVGAAVGADVGVTVGDAVSGQASVHHGAKYAIQSRQSESALRLFKQQTTAASPHTLQILLSW